MKRAVLVTGIVLIAAAYLAGFWPERRHVRELEAQVALQNQRLSVAENRVKLGASLGHLLVLEDAIEAHNFGEAAALASRYFDSLTETSPEATPEVNQALQDLLRARDGVTAALARTEPAVLDVLVQQERVLRRALGYPVTQ